MSISVAPFVVSLVISERVRKYAKTNSLHEQEKQAKYSLLITVCLASIEAIFSVLPTTKLLWAVYLLVLVVNLLRKNEFRPLRSFIMAFVPFVIVSVLCGLAETVSTDFYKDSEGYFKTATTLTYIWIAATLFSQNRQNKITEKERLKRQQEDELNRAIAIRKVELEELVAERTVELTSQKEELEHLLTELRATQSQLIQSEKMASLGELTAGIAHEIQNPLNFVNNFSEVSCELLDEMREEMDSGNDGEAKLIAADIKLNLEKINHHGKRADSIVKGMLLHSRANSGQKEPTDINALADEYLRLSYHGLRAKDKSFNSKFETNFDQTIGKISIVPQEIGRVILNLLNNAFYAVTEKKKLLGNGFEPMVSVSTQKAGVNIEIKVIDNGNGIPQKIIDKIFQPFFTTKPAGQGTGLGLSMCYEIITQAHGGSLEVETKEGEGSAFIIRLPV